MHDKTYCMWLKNRVTRVFSRDHKSVQEKLEVQFLWDGGSNAEGCLSSGLIGYP
jgi:hypothetical protein